MNRLNLKQNEWLKGNWEGQNYTAGRIFILLLIQDMTYYLRPHVVKHLPGDMERLSAALPIAGHASSTRSLALPSVVLTYVAGLAKQQHRMKKQMC